MLGKKLFDLQKRVSGTLGSLLKPVESLMEKLPLSGRPMMQAASIGILILTCVLLLGCSTRAVRPSLPAQAEPRPMPLAYGRTIRDGLAYVPVLREWGTACEADKAVIREVYGHD